MKRPPARRWIIGCSVIGGIALCGIGGTLLFFAAKFVDVGQASGEAEKAAVAYRKAGFAWEQKDLTKGFEVPDSDNAAPLLNVAIANFNEKKFNPVIKPLLRAADTKKYDEVETGLKPFNKGLDLAIVASNKKGLDFHRDWDMGPQLLFPEFATAKGLVKGLCLRAQVEFGQHQIDKGIADLRTSWKIGSLIGHEPTIISLLVQIAIKRIALDAVQRCAYIAQTDRAALTKLESFLNEPSPAPDFGYALRGEAYMGLTVVRNLDNFGGLSRLSSSGDDAPMPPVKPSDLIRTGIPTGMMNRAFATRHFQAWTKSAESMEPFKGDPIKMSNAMEAVSEEISNKKTVSNLLNIILFPVFSQAGMSVVTLEAESRVTRALLAAMKIRSTTGKFPLGLSDIPGKWVDPFNGQPVKILHDGESFRVYSVGPNLKDDGGVVRSELHHDPFTAYDIAACFPPRERSR